MESINIHIVTYNCTGDIAACLESVFQQTYPAINQIIVIDNHSEDGTREILERYADRITIVYNESNRGFAPAHNQAILLSKSDYCFILNPDVVLHPDYIHLIIQFMKENPEAGSAVGKLLLADSPHLLDSAGITMNKARRAFDRGSGTEAYNWQELNEVFGVTGAAAIYRREMIEDIAVDNQFFDESFFAYKEDVDVAWRARLFGWKAYYVPDAIAYHHRGWKKGSRKRQSLQIRQYSYINRYRMIAKNDRIVSIIKHIIPFIAYETASLAYFLLREPQVLAAWPSFIKEIPRILYVRKYIQTISRQRETNIEQFFE